MQNRFNILLQERCFENSTLPFKIVDVLVFSLISLFAILARISLFPYVSTEFTQHIEVWFNTLDQNGGLFAIGTSVGNSTPPYLYLLALLTLLPISPLFSVKIVSCLFDVILALCVLRILMGITKSVKVSLCGYGAILLSPTIMFNSAAWAASDSIYASLIVLCLFAFMKNRPFRGTVLFSIALTIKLQAIFFAPVLIIMWLKNRTRVKYFLAIPIIYIISIIPAALGGRSIFELLIMYIKIVTTSSSITTNSPNFYYLLGDISYEYLTMMGIFLCASVVLIAIYLLYSKIFRFIPTAVITITLLFATLIPYFLPHMNERHFYLAEVLSIVLAFCRPSAWYIAVLINTASFMAYLPSLFGATNVDLFYAFLMMTAGLILLIIDLSEQIRLNGAKSVTKAAQEAPPPEPVYTQAPTPTPAPAPARRARKAPVQEEVAPPIQTQTSEAELDASILQALAYQYESVYEEEEQQEDYQPKSSPFPHSAYTLSPEALAKKIPSIADVIEVKPDPLQEMQKQQELMQAQANQAAQAAKAAQEAKQAAQAQAIPSSLYDEPSSYQQQQPNPYQQPKPNPYQQPQYDYVEETPSFMRDDPYVEPQFPLGSSQRLASDKSPPFSLSQRVSRSDGPPQPPPPPISAPVIPKMTKSEMITKEMEEPKKNRPIPKQYLQQMEIDEADFVEESFE